MSLAVDHVAASYFRFALGEECRSVWERGGVGGTVGKDGRYGWGKVWETGGVGEGSVEGGGVGGGRVWERGEVWEGGESVFVGELEAMGRVEGKVR